MTRQILDKKKELGYRKAEDDCCCGTCEHFIPDKNLCSVMGYVKGKNKDYAVSKEYVCLAWNDNGKENSWYLCATAIKNKAFFLVKEVIMDDDDEEETIVKELGNLEIELPVESIDDRVIEFIKDMMGQNGSPDFFVNIRPGKYSSDKFKEFVKYVCIKYRELSAIPVPEKTETEGNDIFPKEMLSLMIDIFLNNQSG